MHDADCTGELGYGAKSSAMTQGVMPTLQVRHVEGQAWWVAASWPDGTVEDIAGFKSELDANEWIAKDFPRWLEQRTTEK